jgi:hypothetical protein
LQETNIRIREEVSEIKKKIQIPQVNFKIPYSKLKYGPKKIIEKETRPIQLKPIPAPIQKQEIDFEKYGKFDTTPADLSLEDRTRAFQFYSEESRFNFLKKYPKTPLAAKAARELKENDLQAHNREIRDVYFDDSEGLWIAEVSPWFQYKYGFKKPKHPKGPAEGGKNGDYYCARFVQQTFYSNFSEAECRRLGIEGHVWTMIDFLKENNQIIYEREVKSSVLCKNLRKQYPDKDYSQILKMMAEERKKTEKEIGAMLRPGDICIAWNPYSLYKKNLVTHSFISLDDDGYMIMQDWKKKLEIMPLDELYKRIPGGIDFIARPNLAKTYTKIKIK